MAMLINTRDLELGRRGRYTPHRTAAFLIDPGRDGQGKSRAKQRGREGQSSHT